MYMINEDYPRLENSIFVKTHIMLKGLQFTRSMLRLCFYLLLVISVFWSCKSEPTSQAITSKRVGVNEVIVRLGGQPKKLNPLLFSSASASQVEGHLFNYLLVYDNENYGLVPSLAKARPLIEPIKKGLYKGGVSYTYEIQEAATWDNGTPITASDLIFTLKALNNPLVDAQATRAYMGSYKDILTYPESPKKFTIIANEEYILGEAASAFVVLPEYHYDSLGLMKPFALSDLTNPSKIDQLKKDEKIIAFAKWMNNSETNTNPKNIVGSGPYKITKWDSKQELVLEKKENWWGDSLEGKHENLEAFPDKIIYRIVPEMNTALTMLKDEGLDVLSNIPAINYDKMKSNDRLQALYDFSAPYNFKYTYLGLNQKHPILQEKKVRKALAHLMDVEEVIEVLEKGYARRIVGPIHPSKKNYNQSLEPIAFDLTKAKTLLAEAGWEDGDGDGILDKKIKGVKQDLRLRYHYMVGAEVRKNTGILFQAAAKKVGVEIDLEALEINALITKVRAREYDISALSWSQNPGFSDLYQIWHSDSDSGFGANMVSFRNEEVDRLIEQLRVTRDEAVMEPLYKRIQEVVYEEQPYIFMYAPQEKLAIHKRFSAKAYVVRPCYFENTFQINKAQ